MTSTRNSSRRTSSLDGFRRLMETPVSVASTIPPSDDESGVERIGSPDRPLTAERMINNPPPGWGRSKTRRVSRSRQSRKSSRLPDLEERVTTRGRSRSRPVSRSRRNSRTSRGGSISHASDTSRSIRGRRKAGETIREEETAGAGKKTAHRAKPVATVPKTPGQPRSKLRTEAHDIGGGWNASRKEKKTPAGPQFFTSIMIESPADLSAMALKRTPLRRRKPAGGGGGKTRAQVLAAVAAEKSEPPSGKITAVDYERTKQLIALLSGTTYEFVGLSEVSKAHIAAAGNKHETAAESKKKGAKDAAKIAEEKARLKKERQAQHERRTTLRGTVVRGGSQTRDPREHREPREEKQHQARPPAVSVVEEDAPAEAEATAMTLAVPDVGGGHGPAKKGRTLKKAGKAAVTGVGHSPPADGAQDATQPITPMVIPVLVFEADSDSEEQGQHQITSGRSSQAPVADHVSNGSHTAAKRSTPRTSVTETSTTAAAGALASSPAVVETEILAFPSAAGFSVVPDVAETPPEFAMPQQTWGTRPPRKPKAAAGGSPGSHSQLQARQPPSPQVSPPKSTPPQTTAPTSPGSQHLPRIIARASSHGGMAMPAQLARLLPPRPEGNIQYSYRTYLDSIMHPNILLPPFRMPPIKQVLYGPYERQLWEYFCGRAGWEEVEEMWASAHGWAEEEMAVEAM
ncbi:hypothetical protein HDU87_002740 [Geranomyces variabilis]|uniref:Uncharacterized protein n=1 Tax=Geranomyces variabilis TaxID=109894 RepID=A0AAD5TWF8_9FUNG|nr:hypothetical protein HDU87_002740 [Geranomyces variabilis]